MPVELALRTLETNPQAVIKSGSAKFHEGVWKNTFGHDDPTPPAFDHGDLIYLNIDSLSAGQLVRVKKAIHRP